MRFIDNLLMRVSNSFKIRSGVPLDIRNRIEEALFEDKLDEGTLDNVRLFVDLIKTHYRYLELSYFTRLQDGCYPLLTQYDYHQTSAISVGVGNNILLDLALCELGCGVAQFDHTVPGPGSDVLKKYNIVFNKKGLGRECTEDKYCLAEIVSRTKQTFEGWPLAVVKIDCEGCEWSSLNDAGVSAVSQVDQLIVEFHFLNKFVDPSFAWNAIEVLRKLTIYFDIAYISANNFGGSSHVSGLGAWPFTIEMMFVNKKISGRHVTRSNNHLQHLSNWKLGRRIDIEYMKPAFRE
jgi:hypothetical protein